MKKSYFFTIALFLVFSNIKAQNFEYPIGQHIDTVVVDTLFDSYQINIKTPNPEAITYAWTLIENSIPQSWDYSLCDYQTCYITIPNDATMTPISLSEAQSGTFGFFSLTVTTGANYGSAKLSLYVYDSNDFNRGDTISLKILNPNRTGIEEISASSKVSVYPNPVESNLYIENQSNENVKIELFNLVGKLVINEQAMANKTLSVNLEHLNSGIYFTKIMDAKGITKTEKIIIQ